MSFLEYNVASAPTGLRKILYLNWALVLLLVAVAGLGFLMLFSVAGGSMTPWVEPQLQRFGLGLTLMFAVAMVPIWFWRNLSAVTYGISVILLLYVEFFGSVGMGAQRWIDLGFMRLQPSELTKITLVMVLAAYYDWLDLEKTSRPVFVILPVVLISVPVFLTLRQPDLGTAFSADGRRRGDVPRRCALGLFRRRDRGGRRAVAAVLASRGTPWQLLQDYQYRRIDTFLDPSTDPLGAGYHITQSQIALGSGGWTGRGFMEGTQSRLNFLPEKHTDFIFTTLAEEFGFVGAVSLLVLYLLILAFCIHTALARRATGSPRSW
jgi:rod shape determining protein RodA